MVILQNLFNLLLSYIYKFIQPLSAKNTKAEERFVLNSHSDIISAKKHAEKEFNRMYNYLKKNQLNLKEELSLLHKLAQIYKKTAAGKERYEQDLREYGNRPASEKTIKRIHTYLQRKGFASEFPEIYRLEKNNVPDHVLGLTSAQCIWIDEQSLENDPISFEFTCAHEAGHWYFQHSIQDMIHETTLENQEHEADVFAFEVVDNQVRITIFARAQQALEPIDYLADEGKIALLKPKITKTESEILYDLPLPTKEHARTIYKLAQQYHL